MSILDQGEERMMRFAADVVLRNGSTLHLRPVTTADTAGILEFLRKLSPESLELRFCAVRRVDLALATEMAVCDPLAAFGLVGELGGQIVAIAHYYRTSPSSDRAEVAFTIADGMQGLGVGTRLLERLAEVGREHGIAIFEAEVMPFNFGMTKVFLDSGFEVQKSGDREQLHFEMQIEQTTSFEDRAAERAGEAASASMRAIFAPHSIAVVGAGRHRGHLGSELFRNLIRHGFNGKLYPVNPSATEVEYIPAFASVRDIPGDVDLAIISIPLEALDKVVDDCIAKRVKSLVVMTGGFAETGPEGREREVQLVRKIRSAGIRMVGPNAMGLINTDPNVRMHATFTGMTTPRGSVAMSTQSAALGLATLDYARTLNIGFSTFISTGNKADVSGNDLIQYWASDPTTEVILLYLESFGNPQRFGRIARRVARKKPIVAVKSGRSYSGARAAHHHTGAVASSDAIVADLFRQAGIIRTGTIEEMFDVAAVLAHQPLPNGRRVAILTNAAGPAVLATDACESEGLTMATLREETCGILGAVAQHGTPIENPVTLAPTASGDYYRRAMRTILNDPGVDALIVIHIPVFPEELEAVAKGIHEGAVEESGKPVIGTIMSAQGVPESMAPLPCYPFPERAVAALARVASYAEWRKRPVGRIPKYSDLDVARAREIVSQGLAANRAWLLPTEAAELLKIIGIETLPLRTTTSPEEAVAAARECGYPVVMKAVVQSLRRDVETAATKYSLATDEAVVEAWHELSERFGARLRGIGVQQMIAEGCDVMLGAAEQPTFGHLLFYGVSAATYDVAPDIVFRLHPVTDLDVIDMTEEARCTLALQRSSSPGDGEERLRDTLLRLSALIEGCPGIRELEIPQLKVVDNRLLAMEANVRIGSPTANGTRRVVY